MKKLLLFILVLNVFARGNAYYNLFGETYCFNNLHEAVYATIDSVYAIDSTKSVGLQIMIDNTAPISLLKIESNNNVRLDLPLFSNEQLGSFIIGIADSLAKTNNYKNKLLASELCSAALQNTKYWKQTGNCFTPWQRKVVKKAVYIDMEYCYRFIRSEPVVKDLHKCLYDNEINQLIKKQFENIHFTQHEIEVFASGLKKPYSLNDTIGYYEFRTKQTKLNSSEEFRLTYMADWLKDAQANNKALKEHFDSLNMNQLQYEIRNSSKKMDDYKMIQIIKSLDRKYKIEFAPFIDSLFQSGMFPEDDDYFQLVLAQMRYKDYPISQVNYLGTKADSILEHIKKLPENKENNWPLSNSIDSYIELANQLKSIGTQEAYFRLANALLVKKNFPKEEDGSDMISIYFGTLSSYFYIFFKENIRNIPLDTKPIIEKMIPRLDSIAKSRNVVLPPEEFTIERQKEELNSIHIDLFFDKNYCEQIYNWMVKNRGKYEIVPLMPHE